MQLEVETFTSGSVLHTFGAVYQPLGSILLGLSGAIQIQCRNLFESPGWVWLAQT